MNSELKAITKKVFLGVEVYYTGDMANAEGTGYIADIQPNDYYDFTYTLNMADGRVMKIHPFSFSAGPGCRFIVKKEWQLSQDRKLTEGQFNMAMAVTREDEANVALRRKTVTYILSRSTPSWAPEEVAAYADHVAGVL